MAAHAGYPFAGQSRWVSECGHVIENQQQLSFHAWWVHAQVKHLPASCARGTIIGKISNWQTLLVQVSHLLPDDQQHCDAEILRCHQERHDRKSNFHAE